MIEVAVPEKDRRPSTCEAFTIVKNEPYLRVYEELASGFSPRSILELGIFEGGSYVFLDKLFKPRRMSAVEISPKPVAPLLDYLSRTENRCVHFRTSQCDSDKLRQIVLGELADELDLGAVSDPALRALAGVGLAGDPRGETGGWAGQRIGDRPVGARPCR